MTDNNHTEDKDLMTPNGMDGEWQDIKDDSGVTGPRFKTYYSDEGYDKEEMQAIRKDYRWTPACQRAFLEDLAIGGSVSRAARFVEKSLRAAYALRRRRDGATLHLGWSAAILIARERIADMLIDRAVCGYEEFTQKEEDGTRRRGRFDNRLSANMLSRLDRIAEREALAGSRDAQVQLIMQDWEAYLDLVSKGAGGAEVATWLEAIEPCDGDGDWLRDEIECELAQISGDEGAAAMEALPEYLMDEEPEEAAARMHVWWDEKWEMWFTNFPLSPEDRAAEGRFRIAHAGEQFDANITEMGNFGHHGYRRALTTAEKAAHEAKIVRNLAPWNDAAQAARDAWFGEKEAA